MNIRTILLSCVVMAARLQSTDVGYAQEYVPVPTQVSSKWAQLYKNYDQGPVAPTIQIHRMQIVLHQDAARRSELEWFVSDQQNRQSVNFHRWLTPEQFADKFGASQEDASKVASWLKSVGMTNVKVSRGRLFIAFSGTVGSVAAAFHTPIHAFEVLGVRHFANTTVPSIPQSLDGLVSDVIGLHDFGLVSQTVNRPITQYLAADETNELGPGDLATIYDINPLFAKGINGSGVTVAVLGQTPITLDDYRAYRQMFGLASNDFQTLVVPDSGNGTHAPLDQEEATLDVEVMGAVARNATILYVWGASVIDAAEYVVDNRIAQVMNLSYAGPEDTADLYYQDIALQANAEGITWISSAGDSGAAGWDTAGAASASWGLAVMSPANVPQVTAVGGTALSDASSSQYWNASTGTQRGSALSYIPETGWSSKNSVGGGGGGTSQVFALPGYQTDFNTSTARMVPDVAFSSSVSSAPYVIVYQGSTQAVGGTSAATPVFGGIAVLLNHYLTVSGSIAEAGLGNLNPTLYRLAEQVPNVFHDVTAGSNDVPCTVGTLDCTTGILGFDAVPGYDEATGLGSVDAYALVSSWENATFEQSTVHLNASTASIQVAQSVTFTASVAADGSSLPHSPVFFSDILQFTDHTTPPISLGSAVTDENGVAVLTTDSLPAGTNTITVSSGGATAVSGSAASNPVTVTSSPFPTTTTLTAQTATTTAGSSVNFNVFVSDSVGVPANGPIGPSGFYQQGTVTLYSAEGTQLSFASLPSNGVAALSSGALSAGDIGIYATYSGNNYGAASQSGIVTIHVAAGTQPLLGTKTTLSLSSTQNGSTGLYTFTAKVAPQSGSGTPTGTVSFYNGTVNLGTSTLTSQGTAALSTSSLPSGQYSMIAEYEGDTVFGASISAPLIVAIGDNQTGDFQLSGPASVAITLGSNTVVNLSITPVSGFSGAVNLTCRDLSTGYTCTAPNKVQVQGVTLVPVSLAASSAAFVAAMPFLFLGGALSAGASGRKRLINLVCLGIALCFLTACGVSGSLPSSATPKTAVVEVTATSGTLTHSININAVLK